MCRLLLAAVLVLLFSRLALSVPPPHDAVDHITPPDPTRAAADLCRLGYYDICSYEVLSWTSYCGGGFGWAEVGTCFDLNDLAEGCQGCQNLTDVWWAWRGLAGSYGYGYVNLYVSCADENGCRVGPPLAVIVGHTPDPEQPWGHFHFDNLTLDCPTQKFIVGAHMWDDCEHAPYSDLNNENVLSGCEQEWRCEGHSFVYEIGDFSFCDEYGTPAPLWIDDPNAGCSGGGLIPPGCHDASGFYCEFLIDVYLQCPGQTAVREDERESWSTVKALYQ